MASPSSTSKKCSSKLVLNWILLLQYHEDEAGELKEEYYLYSWRLWWQRCLQRCLMMEEGAGAEGEVFVEVCVFEWI